MPRAAAMLCTAMLLGACGGGGGEMDAEYRRAVECYGATSSLYEGARANNVALAPNHERAAQVAVSVFRDRAKTLARLRGEDKGKVEADVKNYLTDYFKRYEASKDKPAMDRQLMKTFTSCAETLA